MVGDISIGLVSVKNKVYVKEMDRIELISYIKNKAKSDDYFLLPSGIFSNTKTINFVFTNSIQIAMNG